MGVLTLCGEPMKSAILKEDVGIVKVAVKAIDKSPHKVPFFVGETTPCAYTIVGPSPQIYLQMYHYL